MRFYSCSVLMIHDINIHDYIIKLNNNHINNKLYFKCIDEKTGSFFNFNMLIFMK